MTYIPTVTVERKLVNYITFLKSRKCIFLVCGTQIFGGINNAWFQSDKDLGRFRYSFNCHGTSIRRQRRNLFGLESSCHLLLPV